jgi:Ser-tRNA(Ala) deacylase AlaX
MTMYKMVRSIKMVWNEITQDGLYGQTFLLQPSIFTPKVGWVSSDTGTLILALGT